MNISILFGGVSYEHEISIVSAITLAQKLGKKVKIESCIFLDSKHDFYLIDIANMTSKYFSSGDYTRAKRLDIGHRGFYETGLLGKKKMINSSLVLNLIHGADGEDGTIAGLLDFFAIPYIGPRIESSVISYNKHLTKLYAREIGLDTMPFVLHKRGEDIKIPFSYPIIIKPVCLGSSIGINIVNEEKELEYALDGSFELSDEVIIEPFVRGIKEYNNAGARIDGEFVLSIIEEPQKKDLLNFDDKYLDFSRTEEILSADISDGVKARLEEAFKVAYNDIFSGALIRCDFFYHEDRIYLNEINPIPGSMANYLFADFEDILIKVAKSLPKKHNIKISYQYINKIQKAKGK